MNPAFSKYLDLFRVVSCFVVVLSHLGHGHLVGGVLWPFTYLGNEAVMAFFVLSGFVIAFVGDQREHTLADYAAARFARLYSVIIPTMLLTLLLDTVGQNLNPSAYVQAMGNVEYGQIFNYAVSALMVNQSWNAKLHFGSNGAYWSIPYEFWYYVLFGAVTKLKGWKRATAAIAGVAIAGPNILLLLPVWLLGVGVYYLTKMRSRESLEIGLAVASVLCLLVLFYKDFSTLGKFQLLGVQPDSLPWRYAVGVCVAVHLYGMSTAARYLQRALQFINVPLQFFAGGTLALYLFHLPILGLVHLVSGNFEQRWVTSTLLISAPLLAALSIGRWCELQKKPVKIFLLKKLFGSKKRN